MWDKARFEAEAKTITESTAGKESLFNAVLKTAKDYHLNREQIDRLARATNVKAFEMKFASYKGKPDRRVDFDVVDSDKIYAALEPAKTVEKKAQASYPELADELYPLGESPLRIKTASEPVKREAPKDIVRNRWLKTAAEFEAKAFANERAWDVSMNSLLTRTKTSGFHHESFEKDAFATLGDGCIFELNALRSHAKLPNTEVTPEQAAKIASQLFEVTSPEMALLKTAKAARECLAIHRQAAAHARQNADTLLKEIVRE